LEEKNNSVLIVDDENSNIMALTYILSPEYKVFAAKSGKNAIVAAEKHLPDIILLDIIMPEMDGYDVLSELKNSEKTMNIPVIFITGLSNSGDEEKGLALGASDYIIKPFSSSIVKLRVRNQIKMLEQLRTIERLSMIDPLTGLPNRRSLDNRLILEWARALRDQSSISILMIDIDLFKNYNDTYGHQQGDVVLQTIAKVFSQTLLRSVDFTSRWGGEEFLVLLPKTTLKGALKIAEQIRVNMENSEIPCIDGTITKVTISIGVNSIVPSMNDTIEKFISAADEALYSAKRTSRNKVVS
jgi:diguanylate cyclase (GGDEF)-like protein